MKDKAQLLESVDRFRQGFWAKKSVDHPPVGIVSEEVFMPIKYLRKEFTCSEIQPKDVNENLFVTDYEFAFSERSVNRDDYLPFLAAWRAVPWLEAICGCPVRYSTGSLAPGHFAKSLNELAKLQMPANAEWLNCLRRRTDWLVEILPADCWVSPTILRGPSDVLAAMRGLTEFYYDLADNTKMLDSIAARINKVLLATIEMHFAAVQPKLGGYGHIYGYWAPGETVVIQEDVMGMCSPNIYHDIFMKYNTRIVECLGGHVLFHLHSTGYQHCRDVLKIDGLAGIQLTVESNGPDLLDMLDDLRFILNESRLILFVNHGFEDLRRVLCNLPREGLYLIIPDKYVKTEKAFRTFIRSNF